MEQFKKLIGVTVREPPAPLDEDEETSIAALLGQARSELESEELANQFSDMVERLRDGSSAFILAGPAILKQMAMIFDFGRRYEAVIQNDMRAEKED